MINCLRVTEIYNEVFNNFFILFVIKNKTKINFRKLLLLLQVKMSK